MDAGVTRTYLLSEGSDVEPGVPALPTLLDLEQYWIEAQAHSDAAAKALREIWAKVTEAVVLADEKRKTWRACSQEAIAKWAEVEKARALAVAVGSATRIEAEQAEAEAARIIKEWVELEDKSRDAEFNLLHRSQLWKAAQKSSDGLAANGPDILVLRERG